MTHGPFRWSAVPSRNAAASSSATFGSCHTWGEWVKICPQLPPTVRWLSTALSTPPATDTCAPTRILSGGVERAKGLRIGRRRGTRTSDYQDFESEANGFVGVRSE